MIEKNNPWAETQFFGLLGSPVRKSLSAAMHNGNFKSLGMNALYTPYEVTAEELPKVIPALESLRFKGLNVTMPLKQEIIKYLDELDEIASLCNAVNTVYWKDGKLCGSNTDGIGFVHGLKEQGRYDPTGKHCLLFGAGGASRGVAFALCAAGLSSITLWGRPSGHDKLQKLASDLNGYRSDVCKIQSTDERDIPKLLKENELIINGTSVGMAPNTDATVFDTSYLESRHMVCDLVYVPDDTKLLRQAAAKGARTLVGYWMTIWQGAEAFRRWTGGKEPDVKVMTDAALQFLEV
ncbi:shikimate dehydrogenase [Dethiosulfovibrio salsuginis]|uniref:Shikimate dehydrogenase (NADP(+)) n=1 Tax=Dethiosulfovibrio salsuginis TaxID=561720 RepID=A0A1X7ILP8_9BACT|nr:shikimate dehydrogenase [Dethiosulfovibrio salsuginis]SMG15792.1 shikimate dehydrogenase [Dethiosulfovibrio salsuginis]